MNFRYRKNIPIESDQRPVLEDKLAEEIKALEEKIFFVQICDDPDELVGVEDLINEFRCKVSLKNMRTPPSPEMETRARGWMMS